MHFKTLKSGFQVILDKEMNLLFLKIDVEKQGAITIWFKNSITGRVLRQVIYLMTSKQDFLKPS